MIRKRKRRKRTTPVAPVRKLKAPERKREPEKLTLVSVSRESPNARKRKKDEPHHHHARNAVTAKRRGLRIVGFRSYVEPRIDVGARGADIVTFCHDIAAGGIIIDTLCRLGAGPAAMELRQMIEAAGLAVCSGDDHEEAILRSTPGHKREADLMTIAARDYTQWATDTAKYARRGPRISAYWFGPTGQAVLEFIDTRRDWPLSELAAFLTAQGLPTPTGKGEWHKMTVKRAYDVQGALRHVEARPLRAVG